MNIIIDGEIVLGVKMWNNLEICANSSISCKIPHSFNLICIIDEESKLLESEHYNVYCYVQLHTVIWLLIKRVLKTVLISCE